jgi:hypothetical protein
MAQIELPTLLDLVGELNDSSEPGSASTRFRKYLRERVQQVSDVRLYVNDALGKSGDQFNKALQDLINHIGSLLGFTVQYGRYRGVRKQIGFDGLWQSPTGRTLVVETKTTDVYTVKTATLLGYINDLVSDGRLKNPSEALGLYVYGRFDSQTNQLENAIIVEGRQNQLRVISVEALLNLLELKQEYELEHNTILSLLLPTPTRVDPIVNLIFDMVSQEKREAVEAQITPPTSLDVESPPVTREPELESYYLLPAADSEDGTPVLDNLHRWVDKGLWGLGQRTGYRKEFKPGDYLCFYAVRTGIVVECEVVSAAFELSRKDNPTQNDVPYAIRVKNATWLKQPIELTADIRSRLSAFQGRDSNKGWAWFVQGTSKLTKADFDLLTGKMEPTPTKSLRATKQASQLVPIEQNYTGKSVQAIIFQNQRFAVATWKDALLTLFQLLRREDGNTFDSAVVAIQGRKRPYVSLNKEELRVPQLISGTTSLYVEINLNANSIVKLCYTLIQKLGYGANTLVFETVSSADAHH